MWHYFTIGGVNYGKIHITQRLHNPHARELINAVAPMIQQINENNRRLSNFEFDLEEGAKVTIQSMCLGEKRMKIIDTLEQKYTIIKSKPHRLLLKDAWNRFKRTGNKEEFLEVLKKAEEAKLKHPSFS